MLLSVHVTSVLFSIILTRLWELHALTLAACSYAFLMYKVAVYYNTNAPYNLLMLTPPQCTAFP